MVKSCLVFPQCVAIYVWNTFLQLMANGSWSITALGSNLCNVTGQWHSVAKGLRAECFKSCLYHLLAEYKTWVCWPLSLRFSMDLKWGYCKEQLLPQRVASRIKWAQMCEATSCCNVTRGWTHLLGTQLCVVTYLTVIRNTHKWFIYLRTIVFIVTVHTREKTKKA